MYTAMLLLYCFSLTGLSFSIKSGSFVSRISRELLIIFMAVSNAEIFPLI